MIPQTYLTRQRARTFAVLVAFAFLAFALTASAVNRKLVGRPEFYAYDGSQISPDSQYVVFTAREEEGGDVGLYSRPLLGGAATRLDASLGAGWAIDPDAYSISPDAQWVVYVVERDADGHQELHKAPIAGPAGASGRLYDASPSWAVDVGNFQFSTDSRWVVFRADLGQDGVMELFRVSIDDGSASRLSGSMVSGGDVGAFQLSPDQGWVVYLADQEMDMYDELYSVPLTGTPDQVAKLNHPIDRFLVVCMPSGDTGRAAVDSFKISPDSGRVVYLAERIVNYQGACDEVGELFSVPIDGSGAAVQIQVSDDENDEDARAYQIGPASDRVVYLYRERREVGLTIYHPNELYSVPIGGPPSAAIKLHPTLAADRDVEDNFKLSPDPAGSRVVYVADRETEGMRELYSVPIGGGSSTKLNPTLLSGATLDRWNYEIAPDGERVVFAVDMGRTYPDYALFSVPLTGPGSAAVEISGPMGAGGAVYAFVTRFKISPDGQQVAYRADQEADEVYELYLVPVAGPQGTSVRVSGPMTPGGDVDYAPSYQFSPDGQWLTYVADQETDQVSELFIYGEGGYRVYLPLARR